MKQSICYLRKNWKKLPNDIVEILFYAIHITHFRNRRDFSRSDTELLEEAF